MSEPAHPRPKLYSLREIAEICGVPYSSVRWWRQTGQLVCLKLGRHPRVRAEDLDAFLASRAEGLREVSVP